MIVCGRQRGDCGGSCRLLQAFVVPLTTLFSVWTAGSGRKVAAFVVGEQRLGIGDGFISGLETSRRHDDPTMIRRTAHNGGSGGGSGNSMDLENMGVLRDLVVASSLSYLSSAVAETNDSYSKKTMEASPYFSESVTIPLAQVVDPTTESGATVFEYSNNNNNNDAATTTLIVACRGSATPINFSTNLRFRLVPLGYEKDTFLVHEGFQEAASGLWKLLEPTLREITTTRETIGRVVFTGHSLGAATAVICATKYQQQQQELEASNRNFPPLEGVVTFGGPRLANRALADHWNQGLLADPIVVTNYVHDKDPILRQNGPLWDSLGFGIVGQEIQCEPYDDVVYPSGKADGPLPIAWNILDHCNYLGIFVGPRLV